ncbi:MAG: hypothetical protein HY064_14785 [Bacteroidetes bacterium]|nr:hypothetical protein [Bacteroidota bacterium]
MKKLFPFIFLFFLTTLSSCKKNPDTTMTFHISNNTGGSYVINMTSQFKSDVESSSASTFDKSITLSGENNVHASNWQCHVTNSNNLSSHISITLTFDNGTPHTCSDTTHADLWCQGQ